MFKDFHLCLILLKFILNFQRNYKKILYFILVHFYYLDFGNFTILTAEHMNSAINYNNNTNNSFVSLRENNIFSLKGELQQKRCT